MMDYKGLYHDLSMMQRRALIAAKKADIAGHEEQAIQWDDFIWELDTFMGIIVLRKW